MKKEGNIMAIDLGINNIVACTNKDNNNTLLVSGKEAKSKNKYVLDEIERLKKINKLSKENRDKENVPNTKRIDKLYEYRKNYMETFMQKVTKMVMDYAKENNCMEIVIGYINLESDSKLNFTQLPLSSLVKKIEHKAKIEGIKVIIISEKYTSGVSAVDEEDAVRGNYNKERRISRGIFVTNEGYKINADINGSLNILRKYIKENKPNVKISLDNSRVDRPIKKRVE